MSNNLMGQSISELRRWGANQPLDHRKLNEPVDAINRMNRGVAGPRQVMADRPGGGVPAGALRTVLVAIPAGSTDDHIVCRDIGDTSEEYTPILVAKPWLLRKTPWDGQTRGQVRYEYDPEDSTKRTAFDSTDATGQLKRAEQIHARYLVDDRLTASPMIPTLTTTDGQTVALLDLNVDSRGWKTYYEWL